MEARRWRVLVTPTTGYGVGVKELQLFAPVAVEQPGEVGGEVPATLALTIGGPATFGAFTPGVARDYETTLGANVISTAGEATLTVRDPVGNGSLVNGSFALREPVHANGAPVGGDALVLRSYDGPVSNDAVSIALRQSIAANEPLRTGTYSKALTFTLSTTTP